MGLRIAIEGNIGVGKTSLMEKLVTHLEETQGGTWVVLHERVDEDPEFKRLLAAYYADPNQRIPLQKWLTARRIEEFKNLDPSVNYILERSFLSDMVFCHLNLMRHERPTGDFISYYYDILDAARTYHYDAVVYLKASPSRCYQAMRNRGREEEAAVPLEYIKEVGEFYDVVLPATCRDTKTPLIEISWNRYGSANTVACLINNRLKGKDL